MKGAERAGQLIDEIVPGVGRTSDLVQEISAASQEQSTGAGQVSTAMNQMSQITQQNASASEELAATAEEMSGQAEQLQDLMRFFQLGNVDESADSVTHQVRAHKPASPSRDKRVLSEATRGQIDQSKFHRF